MPTTAAKQIDQALLTQEANHAYAKELAKHLPGWKYLEPLNEMERTWCAKLIHDENEAQIWLSIDAYRGQLEIATDVGKYRDLLPYKFEVASMKVTVGRPAEVVAKQISKKISANARMAADLIKSSLAEKSEAHKAHIQAIKTLNDSGLFKRKIETISSPTSLKGESRRFYFQEGEGRILGERVELNLSVTPEQALEIAHLLEVLSPTGY